VDTKTPLSSDKSEKTLIVVRHAHREKDAGKEADNGLSDLGHEQAQRILKRFASEYGDTCPRPRLVSSPKIRCMETLRPIADHCDIELEKSPLLDEGGDLLKSARQFLKDWSDSPDPLTIICSHGDWIPVFMKLATGESLDLGKGGYAVIRAQGKDLSLVESLQQP
jgi:8-oxo-(d)GTP phosphatase